MTSKGFYFIGKLSNMSLQHQIKSDLYSFVTAEREREREEGGILKHAYGYIILSGNKYI